MIEALKFKAKDKRIPWQNMLKEALQISFLQVFYAMPWKDPPLFQGGTALRLLYSGPRHSEDLDFVTLRPLTEWSGFRVSIEEKWKVLGAFFEGDLEITEQKTYSTILRWKLKWKSLHEKSLVWVRVELAHYPGYTRELLPLAHLEGFPLGAWTLIPVESKEEILADKLTAVAGRPYLKGRDFFDLWFLKTQGVSLRVDLLREKLRDYKADPKNLKTRLTEVNARLLHAELANFLPHSFRRIMEEEHYASVLKVSKDAIGEAIQSLKL